MLAYCQRKWWETEFTGSHIMMRKIEELLANNKQWSSSVTEENPQFFKELSKGQNLISYGLVVQTAASPLKN